MPTAHDNDILGYAINAHYHTNHPTPLIIHNEYGEPDQMDLSVFLREEHELTELELYALSMCHGRVLDIGAGAGSLSLILQNRGLDVTALEISQPACQVMEARGVQNIVCHDLFTYQTHAPFDTLLLLMNGIGLPGSIEGLQRMLAHLKTLARPGSVILCDSTDVAYLYENDESLKPANRYYGELRYRYQYNGQIGQWTNWMYIDHLTLKQVVQGTGWAMQLVYENEEDYYLARLILE